MSPKNTHKLKLVISKNIVSHSPLLQQIIIIPLLPTHLSIYQQQQMEKYNVTSKGKKTLFCTYYNALNALTNTEHTIQKLSRREDWSDVLAKKDILLMKQNQLDCLPSILEAVQEQGKFFIVLVDQLGINVDDLRKKRLPLQQIVSIGIKVLESVAKLNSEGVEFYDIRPEFFFWNDLVLKVAYAPTKEQSFLKGMNGELTDIRHHSPQTVLEGKLDQVSSVFSAGVILVELICGETLISAKTKLDYIYCLAQLFPKEQPKGVQTLQSKLNRHCSKDLTSILMSMMNPERQKRLKLKQAIQRLQTADLTLPSVSEISKQKSKQQNPSQSSNIQSQKSQQMLKKQSEVMNKQPSLQVLEPIKKLSTEVLQQIKSTSISFNFSFPPQSPSLVELVEQLKIVNVLKKQANVADDVTIATIISEKSNTQELSNFEEFEIPQETVAPQLTVFAKQEHDEDIFNIPGLSEDDDNGLFEMI